MNFEKYIINKKYIKIKNKNNKIITIYEKELNRTFWIMRNHTKDNGLLTLLGNRLSEILMFYINNNIVMDSEMLGQLNWIISIPHDIEGISYIINDLYINTFLQKKNISFDDIKKKYYEDFNFVIQQLCKNEFDFNMIVDINTKMIQVFAYIINNNKNMEEEIGWELSMIYINADNIHIIYEIVNKLYYKYIMVYQRCLDNYRKL